MHSSLFACNSLTTLCHFSIGSANLLNCAHGGGYENCASLQALYSYATSTSAANAPADRPAAAASLATLPELHVEGFDAEQVWLQLDMASAQLVRRAKRLLKKAGPEPSLLTPETEEDLSGQQIALPWHYSRLLWSCVQHTLASGSSGGSSVEHARQEQPLAFMWLGGRLILDGTMSKINLSSIATNAPSSECHVA